MKRPQPTVSVVIPVYNAANYISEAVQSVWRQELEPLEVIVVDDGSNDGTDLVLQELAKKGPLRYFHQTNGGRSAARNRGIQESEGDWIAFLDADDYWLPDKLQAQFQEIGKEDDFAYCGTLLYNDSGDVLAVRPAVPSQTLLNDLLWGTRLSTSTVLVRHSTFAKIGLFDEMLLIGEDWDLFLRLAMNGNGRCIEAPLVVMRASNWDDKYTMPQYETALIRSLVRLFQSLKDREDLRPIDRQRRQVFSWHYSVLAKSFLKHGDPRRFLYYGLKSVSSHPVGMSYLLSNNLLKTKEKI